MLASRAAMVALSTIRLALWAIATSILLLICAGIAACLDVESSDRLLRFAASRYRGREQPD